MKNRNMKRFVILMLAVFVSTLGLQHFVSAQSDANESEQYIQTELSTPKTEYGVNEQIDISTRTVNVGDTDLTNVRVVFSYPESLNLVSGHMGYEIGFLATGRESNVENILSLILRDDTSVTTVAPTTEAAVTTAPQETTGTTKEPVVATGENGSGFIIAGILILVAGGLGVIAFVIRKKNKNMSNSMFSVLALAMVAGLLVYSAPQVNAAPIEQSVHGVHTITVDGEEIEIGYSTYFTVEAETTSTTTTEAVVVPTSTTEATTTTVAETSTTTAAETTTTTTAAETTTTTTAAETTTTTTAAETTTTTTAAETTTTTTAAETTTTTTAETTTTTTTSPTTEPTTAPTTTEPTEASYPDTFTHGDTTVVMPANEVMEADTEVDTVVDQIELSFPWEFTADETKRAMMESVHQQLLNPTPANPAVFSQNVADELTNIEPVTATWDEFVGQNQFVIDVSQWIGQYSEDEMAEIIQEVLPSDPRLFGYENTVYYYTWTNGHIEFYAIAKEEYSNPITDSQADYNAALAEAKAIAQAIMNKTDNEWQRIRLAHDYILNSVNYDPSPMIDHTTNNVYDALLGAANLTKCVGYAQANSLILAAMDIEVVTVGGMAGSLGYPQQAHAWNYVKLGNSWYIVDVTFDDPIFSAEDRDATHDVLETSIGFFLRGTDYMSATHEPYTAVTATDINLSATDYTVGYDQMGRNFTSEDQLVSDMTEFFNRLDLTDNVNDIYEFRIEPAVVTSNLNALLGEAYNASTHNDGVSWFTNTYGNTVRVLLLPNVG